MQQEMGLALNYGDAEEEVVRERRERRERRKGAAAVIEFRGDSIWDNPQ
jgi:hypothetical protein